MSAYIRMMTPMMEKECLLLALSDLGFPSSRIEDHGTPTALVGYRGDERTQTAHLVIRRQYLQQSSNDLGFLATPTGYQAILSDDDKSRYGESWLAQLGDRYSVHSAARAARLAEEERRKLEEQRRKLVESQRVAIYEKAKKLGYQVKESREGESLRLVLIKRTY